MNRRYLLTTLAAVLALLAVTVPLTVIPAAAHPSYGKPCCHSTSPKPTATPGPTKTPAPAPTQTPTPSATATATTTPAAASGTAATVPAASSTTQTAQAPADGQAAFQPAPAHTDPNRMYFPETGHYVSSGFLAYWKSHGGLEIFGYPITEEFTEQNPPLPAGDGKSYPVQYFQRARFEYHPELAGTPGEVQLGLLGSQIYAGK